MWQPGTDLSPAPKASRITIRDLADRTGLQHLHVQTDGDQDQDLMKGHFVQQNLGGGLSLHGGDVLECQAFDVRSSIDEGLSCIFFLDGQIETVIGDRSFGFQGQKHRQATALMLMNTVAENFHRRTGSSQRVAHLVIHASPDWLGHHGCDTVMGHANSARLLTNNLAHHHWTISASAQKMVQKLIALREAPPLLDRLQAEVCAIQIIAEAISHATQSDPISGGLSKADVRGKRTLQRAKQFIAECVLHDLTVDNIAREAGVSVSGLQTLFRQQEHCGILEYVRNLRLDQAYDALLTGQSSISDAAHAAGYRHPANFTTAFKRRFSVPPVSIAREAHR